jgi:hypothetical protein
MLGQTPRHAAGDQPPRREIKPERQKGSQKSVRVCEVPKQLMPQSIMESPMASERISTLLHIQVWTLGTLANIGRERDALQSLADKHTGTPKRCLLTQ